MSARGSSAASARVVALSATVATLMIAQQVASKAVRDGVFLTHYEVTSLPIATLAAALVSFAAALLLGKLIATFSPAAAVPVLFAANGFVFLIEAASIAHAPAVVAATVYLHVAAFGGAVVSGFWSVVNERFDPYTAKKVMGRIAGGATLGGVLGGALTWALSDVEPRWLLAGFGGSSIACAVGIALVGRGQGSEARDEKSEQREAAGLLAGISVLGQHSYPRALAAVVLLVALTGDTIDYVFKSGVVAAGGTGSLVGFFAVFYTATGIATFAIQAVASRRVLKRLGVVLTVGLLPVLVIGLLGFNFAWPSMVALVLLRGGAMVVENSFYRSGYELLYTPVPRAQKRSAKMLIDLGFDRIGTATASGIVLLVLALGWAHVERALLLTALASALAIIGTLWFVRREYVASLADQLRRALRTDEDEQETVKLATTFVAEVDLLDLPSAHAAAATPSAQRPSAADVREAVRRRAAEKQAAGVQQTPRVQTPVAQIAEHLLETPLREALRERGAADSELRQSAPAIVGQLGDLVLSAREPTTLRLAAAELLATVPNARAAAALGELLHDDELRLRRAAALGLLHLCRAAPALRPHASVLTGLAVQELRASSRGLGPRNSFEESSPFRQDARGNELAPALELVFLLLAIGGDESALRLALAAVTSDDPLQRGTGLEYLDNLLPGDLRARLVALAEHPELTQADARIDRAVVEGLAADLRAGKLGQGKRGVAELRRRYRAARREHYDRSGQEAAPE